MKILVIGAGYVGLAMGVILAKSHDVTLLEINEERVALVNEGTCPIHEIGMPELLRTAVQKGKLKAVTDKVEDSKQDIIMICTGTPSLSDGSVDLSQIEVAAKYIFSNRDGLFSDYTVIAIKSTVPPGTTKKYILDRIEKEGLSQTVAAVFNPEFLREGTAVMDALNPDRIVVGTSSERGFVMVREMYEECLGNKATNFLSMTPESAELCKYASNSFLATKISFSNEIANLSERIPGVELESVMRGVGADHRISPSMFGAGAGYGGACLPKDVSGLAAFARKLGVEMPVLDAIQEVNRHRAAHIIEMLGEEVGIIKGKKIAVLGIAFKPNTDDIRNSPGLRVIETLLQEGADVIAHDPVLDKINILLDSKEAKFTRNIDDCLDDADACILMTEWKSYVDLGLAKLTKNMNNKVIIDGRRAFANQSIPVDVRYRTIGKPPK